MKIYVSNLRRRKIFWHNSHSHRGGISPPSSSRNLNGKPCWVHKKYDQNSKTDNIVQLAKAGKITLQSWPLLLKGYKWLSLRWRKIIQLIILINHIQLLPGDPPFPQCEKREFHLTPIPPCVRKARNLLTALIYEKSGKFLYLLPPKLSKRVVDNKKHILY